ncbi:hypothetical protein C8R45DRAFT_932330 [Mycena sanguinolenta]|nr:hypothetical protein C8R45DRAFT_932330 [Mycena sanguinolenta]
MDHLQHVVHETSYHKLKISLLIEVLQSSTYSLRASWTEVITQGISHFEHINDPLLEASFFSGYEFNSQRALQFVDKAWQLSELSGDTHEQSRVLCARANLMLRIGGYATGHENAKKAQQLCELSVDLYNSAVALRLQAECSIFLGNYCQSITQLHRARAIIEICGMSGGVTDHYITVDQAEIHLLKMEYTKARKIFSDIAATTSLAQNAETHASAILNLAYIDIHIGGTAESVHKNLAIAADIFSSRPFHPGIAFCQMVKAVVDLKEHTFDLAQIGFQKCLHSSNVLNVLNKSLCLEQLANISVWPATGKQSNLKWPVIYLSLAYTSKDKLSLHKALLFLGDVFIANGDEPTAIILYTTALEGFTHMDVHQSRGQCMLRLGDVAHKYKNTTEAIVYWKTAQPLFEKSSQVKEMAQIDSRLAIIGQTHEETLVAKLQAPTQLLKQLS